MYMHVYIHTVMCHKYPLAHCGSVLHLLYKGLGAWKFLSLATLKWKLSFVFILNKAPELRQMLFSAHTFLIVEPKHLYMIC